MYRSTGKFKNRFLQASDNGIGYDCKFIVGPENSVVQGHKLLFSVASEVFQAMFYGDLKEENTVKIQDLGPVSQRPLDVVGFECMKHFIYTGEVNFTSAIHALSTYLAARKYLISDLIQECINYIEKQLKPSEVLEFYENCETSNTPEFEELCLKIIEEKTDQAVESDYFPNAESKTIELILKSRCLSFASEIEVFDMFEKWALAEAARKKLSDGDLASSFKHLKKHIRFLTISSEEFTSRVEPSLLLSPTEKRAIESNLLQLYSKPMPEDLSVIYQQRKFLPKSITSETFQFSHTFVFSFTKYLQSESVFSTVNGKYYFHLSIDNTQVNNRDSNYIWCFIQPDYNHERYIGSVIFKIQSKVSVIAERECDDLIVRHQGELFLKENEKSNIPVAEIPINKIMNDKYFPRGANRVVRIRMQFNAQYTELNE
ncbi:BTB/POZ domain-containing protein 3 isoform X2 [Nilaparvata lugens]|uniref:BTB/POZ domain-containing protein 3 isoform X2 n=1 Tax=Nilaparvata lugens TaxID=108931 RepID=UPI00193E5039|nr:BTB/POZ domain-containing protein 3 isoform X2 [Nilaparvata lugens]